MKNFTKKIKVKAMRKNMSMRMREEHIRSP